MLLSHYREHAVTNNVGELAKKLLTLIEHTKNDGTLYNMRRLIGEWRKPTILSRGRIGCTFVEIGDSERKQIPTFNEDFKTEKQ